MVCKDSYVKEAEYIFVYLKSLRRRREQLLIVKCIDNYFSVPKIASPEAINKNDCKMF